MLAIDSNTSNVIIELIKFCTTKGYPPRRRLAVWNQFYQKLQDTNHPFISDSFNIELLKEMILTGYYFHEYRRGFTWKNTYRRQPPFKECIYSLGFKYYKPFSGATKENDEIMAIAAFYTKDLWYVKVTWDTKMQFLAEGIVTKEDLKILAPTTYNSVDSQEKADEEGFKNYIEAQKIKME